MRFPFFNKQRGVVLTKATIDQILKRIDAAMQTVSGEAVNANSAMESSTFRAMVQAVAFKVGALPVHVSKREMRDMGEGVQRAVKIPDRSHHVARLLRRPNDWQTRFDYFSNKISWLMRYGRYLDIKGRGKTGPVRVLQPIHPSAFTVHQEDDLRLRFDVTLASQKRVDYRMDRAHFVHGLGDGGFSGDSPVHQLRNAIGLDMAAEKFGSAFFANGAVPFTMVKRPGSFKTEEAAQSWLASFVAAFSRKNARRAMLLEDGWDVDTLSVSNEESQFLETRKHQRTVLAGGMNVPTHKTGDMERATFNNMEQMAAEFIGETVLPYIVMIEQSLERDLLSEAEQDDYVIRFNLDASLRAAFKQRQEGLDIQRRNGVISPNDWLEREGENPISRDDGGEDYRVLANTLNPEKEPDPSESPTQPPDDGGNNSA